MIEKKNNSVIFKNPYDKCLIDLSYLGTLEHIDKDILLHQENHYFQIGDVLYYNLAENKFAKAIANNSIESEVCGVVSGVTDEHNFSIKTQGFIETDRYGFDDGTNLYLSESSSGKLISIEGSIIVKQIATQAPNGIIVNIQRGYKTDNPSGQDTDYELYTKSELDEIIKNVW